MTEMCNKKYYNDANLSIFWAKIRQNVLICCRFGRKTSSFDKFPKILHPFVKVRESTAPKQYQNPINHHNLSQFDDSWQAAVEEQPSNLYTTTSSNDYRVYMYYYYGLDYNSTGLPDITP